MREAPYHTVPPKNANRPQDFAGGKCAQAQVCHQLMIGVEGEQALAVDANHLWKTAATLAMPSSLSHLGQLSHRPKYNDAKADRCIV